jgi:opacity protein-like surface antigen
MSIRIVFGSPGRRRVWVRLGADVLVPLFALLLGALCTPSKARADDWGFAWEIGAITATPKGNPFVFRLTAIKSYSEEFSLDPSFYLTPYGNNAMYSGSLNAQFHVALQEIHISPFFGLGVAHRKTKHDSDTALMVPMGLSVDRPIGEKLYLIGTFGINLHGGITLEGEKDDASIGLTAGIGYSL